jgi:hypothetical protein
MSHVPLAVRKTLLARIIAFEEIERVLRNCSNKTVCTIARGLVDQLCVRTEGELAAPNNAVPLDHYVRTELEQLARDLEADTRLQPFAVVASTIRSRADPISCTVCATPDDICDGGDFDDGIVDRKGPCIQPLRSWFDLAITIAACHYAVACGLTYPDHWPHCVFQTADLNEKPHPFNSTAEVSGATKHGSPTVVELRLRARTFDWRSYSAVPYVLLHEAFHILEGSEGTPQSPDREDPFAEGWMDWIAFEVLVRTIRGTGSAFKHAAAFSAPDDVEESARLLHEARYDHNTSGVPWVSQRLLAGKRAAQTFLDFCKRCIPQDDDAWLFFLSVSLRLNLRQMTLYQHSKVVEKVNAEITPFRLLPIPEFVATAHYLRKYLEMHDIEQVLAWLSDDT